MFKNLFFFFFVILFFSAPFVKGQMHYLDDYEGIPIVAVYINADARDLTPQNFQSLRDLGAVGIASRIHDQAEYDLIVNNNLKVLPINIWGSGPNPSWVSYYSDAVYTKWEAEGNLGNLDTGEVQLQYDASIGNPFYNSVDETRGIVTKNSTPGKLIFGPAYLQNIKYPVMKIDDDGYIPYTTTFKMKIEKYDPSLDVDLAAPVCKIRVVAANPKVDGDPTYKDIESRILTVRDFVEGSPYGWGIWRKLLFNYDLRELENKVEEAYRGVYPGSMDDPNKFDSMWMEFIIDWAGLDNVKLYVDYVEVKDDKGDALKNQNSAKAQVYNLVSMYNNPAHVLGWMGLNEPRSIDNYEPIRIVDSLIQEASNHQLRYYATFNTGWKDVVGQNQPEYGDNGNVLKVIEFIHRTKIPYISFNLYNYDYPYYPSERPDYYIANIDDYVIRNLKSLQEDNIPFAYSTQSGNFYIRDTATCINNFPNYHNPSSEQMMYHINLGLLFGMKELTMDPFFTLKHSICTDSLYREGLVDAETNALTQIRH